MKKVKKKSEHYINNKEFYQALVVYKNQVEKSKLEGLAKPKVSNYLGDCFLRIANHLAYKPNFVNYMFKDDMICDGIENCIQYIDNFDTNRTNPFAYFTQIVYYAFLRRIAKEKRQLEIKSKIIERSGFSEVFAADTSDLGNDFSDLNSIKDNINYRF
jgi:DNA-directed RNA polymerase specialized sigma24 family protein